MNQRAAIVDPLGLGALLRAIDTYNGTPEVRFGLQLLARTFVHPGFPQSMDALGDRDRRGEDVPLYHLGARRRRQRALMPKRGDLLPLCTLQVEVRRANAAERLPWSHAKAWRSSTSLPLRLWASGVGDDGADQVGSDSAVVGHRGGLERKSHIEHYEAND